MSTEPEGLLLRLAATNCGGCVTATVVPVGHSVPHDKPPWESALVLVQEGVLELTCRSGDSATFPGGSMIFFRGLDLATAIAVGPTDAVLLTVTREQPKIMSPEWVPRGRQPR